MGADVFPEEVRRFLHEHVRSLIALELLLLMHADAAREWTAAELSRELRAGEQWAEQELQNLAQRGLAAASAGDPPRYRYAPQRAELAAVVAQLAALYPERRFSVLQIIFSAPSSSVQSFADAFKLRKEGPNG